MTAIHQPAAARGSGIVCRSVESLMCTDSARIILKAARPPDRDEPRSKSDFGSSTNGGRKIKAFERIVESAQ